MPCSADFFFLWKEPGRGWCPLGPEFNNSLKATIRWSFKWFWTRRFYNWINLATFFQQPVFSFGLSFGIRKCFNWHFIVLANTLFIIATHACRKSENKGVGLSLTHCHPTMNLSFHSMSYSSLIPVDYTAHVSGSCSFFFKPCQWNASNMKKSLLFLSKKTFCVIKFCKPSKLTNGIYPWLVRFLWDEVCLCLLLAIALVKARPICCTHQPSQKVKEIKY